MMLLFIIVTFLVNVTEQLCSAGCLKCDSGDNCHICDATSLYILIMGECKKQELNNCLLSFYYNSCLLCQGGYYLDVNMKCVPNPIKANRIINCVQYESYQLCARCRKYYYVSENKKECVKVQNKIQYCEVYAGDGICLVCADTIVNNGGTSCIQPNVFEEYCHFYSNTTVCVECHDGYFLNKNYYIDNMSSVFKKIMNNKFMYFQTYNQIITIPQCQKKILIQNCLEYSSPTMCKTCSIGFYLSDDKLSCKQNPSQEIPSQAIKIPNCYKYESADADIPICIMCYQKFYVTANGKKCAKHTKLTENCQTYSQAIQNQCIACIDGYYLSKNDKNEFYCEERSDIKNCAKMNPVSNSCELCSQSTYIKHYNNQYCSPPISNCKQYVTTEKTLTCEQCIAGYYYSLNTNACEITTSYDPYCNFFDSSMVCSQCINGYYFDSTLQKCTPNDGEYLALSSCQLYSQSKYNTCVQCEVGSTITQIENTCKLPPYIISDTVQSILTNCKQYKIDSIGDYMCVEPMQNQYTGSLNLNENNYQQTFSSWKPIALNIDTSKVQEISKDIKYCVLYDTKFSSSSPPLCLKCLNSIIMQDYYIVQNICSSNDKIPFCSTVNNSINRPGNSPICLNPFSKCGTMYVGYDNPMLTEKIQEYYEFSTCMNKCPCQTKDANNNEINPCQANSVYQCSSCGLNEKCISMCQLSNQNDCYYINKIAYPNASNTKAAFYCNSNTASKYMDENNNEVQYCSKVYGLSCTSTINEEIPTAAIYVRQLKYQVVLIESKKKCVVMKQYLASNNCMEKENNFCLLCLEGYFPTGSLTLSYSQQKVVNYQQYANQQNMTNCISYDSINKKCLRCDYDNEKNLLNIQGQCMSCLINGSKVTDPTETLCLNLINDNFGNGTCMKTDKDVEDNNCIECNTGYVPIYLFNEVKAYHTNVFIYVDNVKTQQNYTVRTYQISSCLAISKLFDQKLNGKSTIEFCAFGYIVLGQFYCLMCKFGYEGTFYKTDADVVFVDQCQPNTMTCNQAIFFVFNNAHVRPFISCHKCQDSTKIPTVFIYFWQFSDTTGGVQFKQTGDPANDGKLTTPSTCKTRNENLNIFCAAQLLRSENTQNNQEIQYIYKCLACLPGYRPSTKPTTNGAYPFNEVISCSYIENCQFSNVTNVCQECAAGYLLSGDGQYCVAIPNDKPELKFCKKATNNICDACKNGYVSKQITDDTFECQVYSVSSCLYYNSDQCIQSSKKLAVNYNILYASKQNYVIASPNCEKVQDIDKIDNCQYYSTQTKCLQCATDYILVSNGKSCLSNSDQKLTNCKKYDNEKNQCQQCEPEYMFNQDTLTCITTKIPNVTDANYLLEKITECYKYSFPYCGKCNTGYYPVTLKSVNKSVCVKVEYTQLCSEFDENYFLENGVMRCSFCHKVTDLETLVNTNQIALTNFDFIDVTTYNSFQLNGGRLQYSQNYSVENLGIRAAIKEKQSTFYCRKFGGIENCVKYDNESFNETFKCLLCDTPKAYVTPDQTCLTRTIRQNCIKYDDYSDSCLTYINTSTDSYEYSALDIMVLGQDIPAIQDDLKYSVGIIGCQIYYNASSCLYCQNGKYLYDNICLDVTQEIFNCEIYYWDNVCLQCRSGYVLVQNKCLKTLAENCEEYLTSTQCLRCPRTFPQLLFNGSCGVSSTISNCVIMLNPVYCQYCKPSYVNKDGLCVASETFVEHCKSQVNNLKCSQCDEGYYLSSNREKCILNPTYDRNCKIFEARSICVICRQGFYMVNNQCKKCKTDSQKCSFCDPINPSQCVICQSGFYMNSKSQCIIIIGYVPHKIELYQQNLSNINLIGS